MREKLAIVDHEIDGLRARMGKNPNAVQRKKYADFMELRDDYRKAAEAEARRDEERRRAG